MSRLVSQLHSLGATWVDVGSHAIQHVPLMLRCGLKSMSVLRRLIGGQPCLTRTVRLVHLQKHLVFLLGHLTSLIVRLVACATLLVLLSLHQVLLVCYLCVRDD